MIPRCVQPPAHRRRPAVRRTRRGGRGRRSRPAERAGEQHDRHAAGDEGRQNRRRRRPPRRAPGRQLVRLRDEQPRRRTGSGRATTSDMLAQIRRLGFNTIRLPFSLAGDALADAVTGVDFSGGATRRCRDKTPLRGDGRRSSTRRRARACSSCSTTTRPPTTPSARPLVRPGGYTEDDWVADLAGARRRYRDQPNVIGADLKNEPHGDGDVGHRRPDRLAPRGRARRQRRARRSRRTG